MEDAEEVDTEEVDEDELEKLDEEDEVLAVELEDADELGALDDEGSSNVGVPQAAKVVTISALKTGLLYIYFSLISKATQDRQ